MAEANFALSPAQMQEAAQLYVEHGWTGPDIAEHFGVSKTAARNALRRMGVQIRAHESNAPKLRMKQCSSCLHFLPVGLFSGRNGDRDRIASWCNNCTSHPRPAPWRTNPKPLEQAISHWRAQ